METKKTQKGSLSVIESGQFAAASEKMAENCRRIIGYLEKSECYKISNYSLWDLSHDTKIPLKVISKSINKYMGRNFYELINRLRIEEAKRKLREIADCEQNVLMEKVGAECGFLSRSVFFVCFKKYEGMTPGKYMKLYKHRK